MSDHHTSQPTALGPPSDVKRLRRSARIARIWSVVLWVLAGLMLLGRLSALANGAPPQGDGSAGYAIGVVIGTLIAIGLPAIGALVLGRRAARLRRQADTLEVLTRPPYA